MFKSALIYQFTDGHTAPSQEQLEAALAEHECGQLTAQEVVRTGFYRVHGEQFTFQLDDLTLFAIITRSKDIPTSTLAAEFRKRRALMEQELGRWLGTNEKAELKEDIITDLLPRAFVTEKVTQAYIDHDNGLIVVDTSSANRAEEVLALLRKALETLPVRPWDPDCDPRYVLTDWLKKQKLPEGFKDGYAVHLDSRESGEAKLKDISLTSEEVLLHLNNDRMVSKIALIFDEVEFNLADWMQITGIKPTDTYKTRLEGQEPEERLASELTLFSAWLLKLKAAVDAAMSDEVAADGN